MVTRVDVAVIGAGVVGLAHAWAAVRRRLSVALFERSARAQGASIRNLGMVWPIGQPAGPRRDLALRGRADWLLAARAAGFWHSECGSLHLAHAQDELAVLEEFSVDSDARMLTPAEVEKRSQGANTENLLGALWSSHELAVDPREALPRMTDWIARQPGVLVRFGRGVREIRDGVIVTADGASTYAQRIFVCAGSDLESLFPTTLAARRLERCKVHAMRSAAQPEGWRLGPHLAGGLSIPHCEGFSACPSLSALRDRIASETPELARYSIRPVAAQNALGEVVLGDSHEYGDDISPFDNQEIEALLLEQLRRVVRLPRWEIAARWNGEYAQTPVGATFVSQPLPGVLIVTGTGSAGMTMAFGVADRNLN